MRVDMREDMMERKKRSAILASQELHEQSHKTHQETRSQTTRRQTSSIMISPHYAALLLISCLGWSAIAESEMSQSSNTCGYPGSPAHASVTFNTSKVNVGTVANYACDNGYELLGPPRRLCQANGTWSPVGIPFCVLNVGLGKAAMQSSTAGHGSAQKAVDGSTSPYFQTSTCTMTDVEHNPWWYVNLLEPYLVQIVRIDFGTACCANRQKATIAVRVGNNRPDLGNNPVCNRYHGLIEEGKPLFLPCTRPAPGAFVSIHLESPTGSALSICETFIYTDHALSIEQCPSFRDQSLGSTATYNGKCYLFHNNQALNFDSAKKFCETRAGSLVDETSPALQGFLSWELYRRHRNDQLMGQYWLGAVRDARNANQSWKWINGKDLQISFWNSIGGQGNCSRFDGSKGWLWSETDCNSNLNFICQHKPLSCGKPERPTNSSIITKSIDNATVIEYQCAPGNLLMGPKVRVCQPTGFFSEFAPKCKFLDCQFPAMIPNGDYKLLNGTTSYQSVVSYMCNEGYQIYGKTTLTCDVDERWNGPPPRCEPLLCPAPVPPSNGFITLNSNITLPGAQASYECKSGYELVGDRTLTCLQSGSWDNSFPYCREKTLIGTAALPTTDTPTLGPQNSRQSPSLQAESKPNNVLFPTSSSLPVFASNRIISATTSSTQPPIPQSTINSTALINGMTSQPNIQSQSTSSTGQSSDLGDQNRKASQSTSVSQFVQPPTTTPVMEMQPALRMRPLTSGIMADSSPQSTFVSSTGSINSISQQPTRFTMVQLPTTSSGNTETTTSATTNSVSVLPVSAPIPAVDHAHSPSTANSNQQFVFSNLNQPVRAQSTQNTFATARYGLDGIIAVAIFGGFIFLSAIIAIIVIIIRRNKSSSSSPIDAQTIRTYDTGNEPSGLYRNYQQAWENLRFGAPSVQPKSSGKTEVGTQPVGLKNFGSPVGHHHAHHLHSGHHNLAMNGSTSSSQSSSHGGDPLIRGRYSQSHYRAELKPVQTQDTNDPNATTTIMSLTANQTLNRNRVYSSNSIGHSGNAALRASGNVASLADESRTGSINRHHHSHQRHSESADSSHHRRLMSNSTPSTSTRSSLESPPNDEHSLDRLAYGSNWGSARAVPQITETNPTSSDASILPANRAHLRYN